MKRRIDAERATIGWRVSDTPGAARMIGWRVSDTPGAARMIGWRVTHQGQHG